MNLNKAMIIGNLVRDPEVKSMPNGQPVTTFSVATNLVWTDQATGQRKEKAEFHNIVAWRKLAEVCGQYLRKGSKVYIEGRLQTRDWTGQDGIKRYRTEIVAENMIMLDRQGANPAAPGAYQPAGNAYPAASDESSFGPDMSGEEEIKIENIPF